ncbi:MAG: AI-2E family transporter [Clostridia bacterium]|nr:AI-2E family transporter [Clostridia bacterium]
MENITPTTTPSNKNFWDKHPGFSKALCLFCVIAASISLYFIFLRIDIVASVFTRFFDIIEPVFYGITIAFLLNPLVKKLETNLLKMLSKKSKKDITYKQKSIARFFSIFISVIIAIFIIYLITSFLFPEIVQSLDNISETLPTQINSLGIWTYNILADNKIISLNPDEVISSVTNYITNWLQTDLTQKVETWVGYLTNGLAGVIEIIFNLIIGFACSIYMLYNKEKFFAKCKKTLFAFLKPEQANSAIKISNESLEIFNHSIIGKIFVSIIIGFICFIGVKFLHMPYPVLISFIIGLTNFIPFFGPWIGGFICGVLILLTADPIQAIYFGLFILFLQQFDCNFLTPKIVGNYIGLPAFWVLVACLLGGGFYGIIGLILGVPIFAIIYQLFRDFVSHRLKNKKLPSDTSNYLANGDFGQNPTKTKE